MGWINAGTGGEGVARDWEATFSYLIERYEKEVSDALASNGFTSSQLWEEVNQAAVIASMTWTYPRDYFAITDEVRTYLIEMIKWMSAKQEQESEQEQDYLALYEAKYGVDLTAKGDEWYMDNVYPLSILDWAAQQLGYALPNAEEVDAISF